MSFPMARGPLTRRRRRAAYGDRWQTLETGKNPNQRDKVEDSMKKATEQQPENFKDQATDEKKVEVGPEMKDAPIKGIDAPERPGSGR